MKNISPGAYFRNFTVYGDSLVTSLGLKLSHFLFSTRARKPSLKPARMRCYDLAENLPLRMRLIRNTVEMIE